MLCIKSALFADVGRFVGDMFVEIGIFLQNNNKNNNNHERFNKEFWSFVSFDWSNHFDGLCLYR